MSALRPRQWSKNLLVFVPLLMSHRVLESGLALQALLSFVVFDLVASAGYVINDLRDRRFDVVHAEKRHRPFASGELTAAQGAGIVATLLLMAAALSLRMTPQAGLWTLGYLLTALAYTFVAKGIAVLDVVVLATLYTIRLLAGGAAVRIEVSAWLAAFSVFLFFSLAVLKRYSELRTLRGMTPFNGRAYGLDDLELLRSAGVSAGYVSVVVLALYINSAQVRTLYAHPQRLWMAAPVLLFWLSYIWLRAHRGEVHDDPVVFTLTDRVSLAVGAAMAVAVLVACF